ncbi:DUF3617 domain-containing protein [Aurantiacibacter luteus]|uniref:DUF3617 domain-containing protein n=1 Tax=Aurantiacibacter luteus TaxID=1581420 RepID=A0A0G9N0C9_9SPHN|nr:DUF3617 family protein [Aurantiacibacter luteus]KLE34998.1 hypothetical protein AAW00_00375 [Aurantiacibacter luteus]
MDERVLIARADTLPRPQPGLYRTTNTLVSFAMADPGPADEAFARENLRTGIESQGEHCITAAQAARGYRPMLEAMNEDQCRFDRFDVDGERAAAEIDCGQQGAATMQIAMTMTARATSSRMESRVVQTGPDVPGQRLELVRLTESERIGECPAPAPPQAAAPG